MVTSKVACAKYAAALVINAAAMNCTSWPLCCILWLQLTAPPQAEEGAAVVPPAAGMTPPPGLERGMHQQQPHVVHCEYLQSEGLQDCPGFPQITISQQQQQQQQQPPVAFSSGTATGSGSRPLGATATAPAGDPSLPESGAVS
jgi:hypothetical protein